MKQFKIKFPGGYEVDDVSNDNIDLHVILQDNRVFFGTAFTVMNIRYLIEREQEIYFWATDMFILKNLEKITIRKSIEKILEDGFFELIFSNIGTLKSVYPSGLTYNEINDDIDSE